jgi:SAM-dependent methyltransferase
MRLFKKEAVDDYRTYEGIRLPLPNDRFCTQDWKDDAYYLKSAKKEVERLKNLTCITSDSKILDIGAGQGRLAIGLSQYIDDFDKYYGLDVDLRSVNWCKKNITSDESRFSFIHLDVYNARYNKKGLPFHDPLVFPFVNDYFDLVFLYSVFTHMTKTEVVGYLFEISRVLNRSGEVFFTIYVAEDVSMEEENPKGYLENLGESKGPLHRVLFNKKSFEQDVISANFEVVNFWPNSEKETMQSTYLLRKL